MLLLPAVLLLGLSACTGPTAPVGSVPGSTGTASPSPSTSAVPLPTRPPEKPTPDSAIAFVRYFWALYNYAYQTYDTKPLEAISDKACRYCSSSVDDVERIAKAKTEIEGFDITATDAAVPAGKIISRALVVAISRQATGLAITSDGSKHRLPGFKRKRFNFALAWKANHWSIHGVSFESDKS